MSCWESKRDELQKKFEPLKRNNHKGRRKRQEDWLKPFSVLDSSKNPKQNEGIYWGTRLAALLQSGWVEIVWRSQSDLSLSTGFSFWNIFRTWTFLNVCGVYISPLLFCRRQNVASWETKEVWMVTNVNLFLTKSCFIDILLNGYVKSKETTTTNGHVSLIISGKTSI